MAAELNNEITDSLAPTTEPTTVENKTVEPASEFKAPTEDEFNKAIQSASSKAKFAILQELGIKSVDEFKQLKATYETSIKDAGEIRSKLETSEKEKKALTEDLATVKLGISDEYKEDFLTLVHSKVSDSKTFDEAAKEVLSKNPTWQSNGNTIKLGVEKSETKIDSSEEARRKNILRMAGL